MSMKKGFTLIELLAVIIILAVIALIAIPAIRKLVDSARRGAFIDSAYGIIKAGEMMCVKDMLNLSNQVTTFTYADGKESSDIVDKELKYKGERPRSGDVIINTDCGVEIAIHNGKWCAQKAYNEDTVVLNDKSESECKLGNLVVTNPVYTDEQIGDLVYRGWIPIANSLELSQIEKEGQTLTFGTGTDWEGQYEAGMTEKYIQVQDIDLNNYDNWSPIGFNARLDFQGIYNGNYNTISNLKINDETGEDVGLFYTVDAATIQNLKILNASIIGNGSYISVLVPDFEDYNEYDDDFALMKNIEIINATVTNTGNSTAGGAIAYSYIAILDNIKVSGTISGDDAGGIVGYNDDSTILNSSFNGEVSGNWAVGGIAGWNMEGSYIYNSAVNGNIKTINLVDAIGAYGGIAGYNDAAVIEDTQFIGTVSGANDGVGGIAGYHEPNTDYDTASEIMGIIKKCSVIGNVMNIGSETWNPVGGIAGNSYDAIISDSYVIGNVSGSYVVGGIAGDGSSSKISNTFIYGDVLSSATSGEILIGGITGISSYDTIPDYNGLYEQRDIRNSFLIGDIILSAVIPFGLEGASYKDNYIPVVYSGGFINVKQYSDLVQFNADSEAFEDWDFTNVWERDLGTNPYPFLIHNIKSVDQIYITNLDNDIPSFIFNFDTGTIIGYIGKEQPIDLVIPSSFSKDGTDYPVVAIGDESFRYNAFISITIPDTVKIIGDYAFANGVATSVTIPDGVTTIGSYAFMSNLLESATIPNSVINIGKAAFADNALTAINLPNTLTKIPESLFYSNALTSISIPNSIISIEENAFERNTLSSLTIPSTLRRIEFNAFADNNLTSLTVPNTLEFLGPGSFSENDLASIDLPNTLTRIEASAFEKNKLTSLTIPSGVQYIGARAFMENLIQTLALPNTLTYIGSNAFNNNKLASLIIPTSVTEIGGSAFYKNKLLYVEIHGTSVIKGTNAFRYNGNLSNSIDMEVYDNIWTGKWNIGYLNGTYYWIRSTLP